MDKLLTVKQVAAMLGEREKYVRELMAAHKLTYTQMSLRKTKIRESEVNRFLEKFSVHAVV